MLCLLEWFDLLIGAGLLLLISMLAVPISAATEHHAGIMKHVHFGQAHAKACKEQDPHLHPHLHPSGLPPASTPTWPDLPLLRQPRAVWLPALSAEGLDAAAAAVLRCARCAASGSSGQGREAQQSREAVRCCCEKGGQVKNVLVGWSDCCWMEEGNGVGCRREGRGDGRGGLRKC